MIKVWPRAKGVDDTDLEDVWRSEIRQLQRLAAVPRADDLFIHMTASGKDAEAFYLALDPGQGSPLETFLQSKRKPDALALARQPHYRRLLWANARRLPATTDDQVVIHLVGSVAYAEGDLSEVFTAIESEDELIVGVDKSSSDTNLSSDTP